MADDALLDTHAFIWFSVAPEALSETASAFMRDRSNRIYVSAVTAWEIAIKVQLGKLPAARQLAEHYHRRLAQYQFLELPFTSVHALTAGNLASPHKDPFDRALAAQALSEQLPIITGDASLGRLPGVEVLW